jgi:hypothetical protein
MELYEQKSTGTELPFYDFKVTVVHKEYSLKAALKSVIKNTMLLSCHSRSWRVKLKIIKCYEVSKCYGDMV